MTTAGILVIGTEVLNGQVEEVNARFLTSALREAGVRLERVVCIRDTRSEIAADVAALSARFDHVFTTGGVGGTHDDITMGAVAEAFGMPLRPHEELLRLLESHYGSDLNEVHRRMADVPAEAELLYGSAGAVPVVRVRNVFVLPGAPRFMRAKWSIIRPLLEGREMWSASIDLSVPEEDVADLLAEAHRIDPEVEVGSYPQFEGGTDHRVHISVEGPSERSVQRVWSFVADGRSETGGVVRRVSPRRVGGPGGA